MFVNNELLAKWHSSMKNILAIFLVLSVCGSSFAWTQDDGTNFVNKLTESLTPEKVCTSNGAGNPKLFLGKIDGEVDKLNQSKKSLDDLYADNQLTRKLYESSTGSMDASLKYLARLKKIYIENCMK